MKRLLSTLFLLAAVAVSAAPYQFISTNNNTIYINPNGNNLAGVKGRPDLPFQTIEAAKAVGALGDTFYLSAGTHVFTNPWVLLNGQSVIGEGPVTTFLKWGGGQYSTNNNGKWTSIELATNNYVANFDIAATNWNAQLFAACIGGSGSGHGISNAVVENVWMHGDTDNFYVDNNLHLDARLRNCRFQSKWDTIAIVSASTDSHLWLENCVTVNLGPPVSGGSDGAVCIRNGAASRCEIIVEDGDYTSSQLIGSGGGLRVSHSRIHTTNVIAFALAGGSTPLFFDDVNVTERQIQQDTSTTRTAGPVAILNTPLIIVNPLKGYGSTTEDTNYYPVPGLGQMYWNSNTLSMRIFNGLHWQNLTPQLNTNKVLVSGTGTAIYNGVYIFKTSTVDSKPGMVWTNQNGKFLMYNTNAAADGVFGISDTESMTSGTEFDVTAGADSSPIAFNFNRAGWDSGNDIRMEFCETDTLANTAIVIGTAYTNQTSKAQMIIGLCVVYTAAGVPGRSAVNVEISSVFTNTIGSELTSATVVTGTSTNALPALRIPSGSRYKFLDSSTGPGNSAALSGGQVF